VGVREVGSGSLLKRNIMLGNASLAVVGPVYPTVVVTKSWGSGTGFNSQTGYSGLAYLGFLPDAYPYMLIKLVWYMVAFAGCLPLYVN
jgi:hypothetical protein